MAARSAAGGRAAAEGPSPPCTQKPSAPLPNFTFTCPYIRDSLASKETCYSGFRGMHLAGKAGKLPDGSIGYYGVPAGKTSQPFPKWRERLF